MSRPHFAAVSATGGWWLSTSAQTELPTYSHGAALCRWLDHPATAGVSCFGSPSKRTPFIVTASTLAKEGSRSNRRTAHASTWKRSQTGNSLRIRTRLEALVNGISNLESEQPKLCSDAAAREKTVDPVLGRQHSSEFCRVRSHLRKDGRFEQIDDSQIE